MERSRFKLDLDLVHEVDAMEEGIEKCLESPRPNVVDLPGEKPVRGTPFYHFLRRMICCGSDSWGDSRFFLSPTPPLSASSGAMREDDYNDEETRTRLLLLLLVKLCNTLHKYGAPTHRTEDFMERLAKSFRVEATFAVMPNLLMLSIGPYENNRSVIVRTTEGLNAEKLHLTYVIAEQSIARSISIQHAYERLGRIDRMRNRYGPVHRVLSLVFCGAAIAPLFFQGGWWDVLFSGIFGGVVGILDTLSIYYPTFSRTYEVVATLCVGFLSRLVLGYFHEASCTLAITLSSIIWLLPGLSLTESVLELATRNLVSGTVRFFSAFITCFKLGFGLAIGATLASWAPTYRDSCPNSISPGFTPLFFLGTTASFCVLMSAHPWQWPVMMLAAGVSFGLPIGFNHLGAGPEVTTAATSFAVGIIGNIYSRLTRHPSVVPVVAGILILVPGSIGVRGATAFLARKTVTGVNFAIDMIVTGLSIIMGLLLSNLLVAPLRSASFLGKPSTFTMPVL